MIISRTFNSSNGIILLSSLRERFKSNGIPHKFKYHEILLQISSFAYKFSLLFHLVFIMFNFLYSFIVLL